MCSQLIQHVNIPLEICANVFGFQCMSMRIIHWFYMGAHWTVHESLYGIYIGLLWISIRIYIDFYIILYGSAYGFICWKFITFLYEHIIILKQIEKSCGKLILWSFEATTVWNMCNFVWDVHSSEMLIFDWKYVHMCFSWSKMQIFHWKYFQLLVGIVRIV